MKGGYIAFSCSDDLDPFVEEADHARWCRGDDPAVDYHIHPLAEELLDDPVVAQKFAFPVLDAGADDGGAHLGNQVLADPIVGDPDAGRLPLGEDYFGNGAGGLENERIGPGEETFHDLVGVVGDPRVSADVLEVGADEAERLPPVAALDLVDPLNSLLVEQVAPNPVDRVGRIDDDPAAAEDLHRPADQPHLGILIVDGDQHIVSV